MPLMRTKLDPDMPALCESSDDEGVVFPLHRRWAFTMRRLTRVIERVAYTIWLSSVWQSGLLSCISLTVAVRMSMCRRCTAPSPLFLRKHVTVIINQLSEAISMHSLAQKIRRVVPKSQGSLRSILVIHEGNGYTHGQLLRTSPQRTHSSQSALSSWQHMLAPAKFPNSWTTYL